MKIDTLNGFITTTTTTKDDDNNNKQQHQLTLLLPPSVLPLFARDLLIHSTRILEKTGPCVRPSLSHT